MSLALPQWLCFDLDGTLVDSVPDITFSVNEMLEQLELEVVDETLARTWIGNGAAKLIERALTHAMDEEPSNEMYENAKSLFFVAYEKNIAVKTTLYPGCIEVLEHFTKQNIPLACVTNKPRKFTPPLLEKLAMADFFQALVCGDDMSTQKPDPAMLLEAVRQLSGDPCKGYMIGDSETDIATANCAGTGAIYVSYGYNRGVSIEKYQPICVNSLEEIANLF
ncbi:MAG: phosphoglycolate phosphatase [Gammaproteobacteria bacterium]|nr:phosphoglycolate phosphatase [Gammaproteobacteria bacterium]